MNIYDRDELPYGDDFPVTGGFPLPSDIDDEPEYKFILVGPDDEWVCDLATKFTPDLECQYKYGNKEYEDCPDVWSSEAAYSEALECLNYSVKVVKK